MNKIKFLLLCVLPFFAQGQSLSESARISLLTCGGGDDLYSVFGHSAIRVNDPESGFDMVFNYGTFDFDAPNFYLKFARGKLDYVLSISSFNGFMRTYQYEERYVFEQELNLNSEERLLLFEALRTNYMPENRFYRYDFFYDNCSTRIRDILKKVLGDKLDYRFEDVEETDKSFRDYIDDYTFNVPWGDFGIDMALGLPTDKKVIPFHQMFLPEKMMDAFERGVITDENGARPLVSENRMLLDLPVRTPEWQWFTPVQVFWLLFVLTAIFTYVRRSSKGRTFDNILFTVIGLVGIVMVLLWFATDHTATAYNFNLLWSLPTWLLVAFLPSKSAWRLRFVRLHFILLLAMFVGWFFWPQALHIAVVPIGLTLMLRVFREYRFG